MNFDFSEEQYSFRDSIRDFLGNHKGVPAADTGRVSSSDVDRLWSTLADLGAFSLLVPEVYGGLGLSFVDLTLVLEEFGRELVPSSVIETLVATELLARYGSAEQKPMILPRIAKGRVKISSAVSEANAGYDPADTSVVVRSTARGQHLNGVKILVPAGGTADFLLVAALCDGDRGPGLILLERGRSGIEVREHETFDLMSAYHEVTFDNVAIADHDFLGGLPSQEAVMRLMDASAASAAVLMTGIAGKVMDTTVEYVKQRQQFGKPIGSFQAIKHKCADMAVAVDSCRSASYYAAWAFAGNTPDQPKAVSIAKSFCGEMSRMVCNEGIQLHGGMGFTWDLGLHYYLRRAKLLEYSFGDASYHRKRVTSAALEELRTG
jgi:alkylation response protein AidB-like acyl-CoA dehydrogenase